MKGRPNNRRKEQLNALREMHATKSTAIRERLREFSQVRSGDYFYELLYIRFHRTKAKHLMKLKEIFPTVLDLIAIGLPPLELRERLIKQVKGLGLKEATHFLRNIGKNGGLAILDRHILRNLKRCGVIKASPKSLTRKRYLSIERRFIEFSERVGIPIDELDLLFWSMETGEIRK
jgi:N-glycosylase/DNA lyase